jgi:hypothetical protein
MQGAAERHRIARASGFARLQPGFDTAVAQPATERPELPTLPSKAMSNRIHRRECAGLTQKRGACVTRSAATNNIRKHVPSANPLDMKYRDIKILHV